jgi:hypothetical protein
MIKKNGMGRACSTNGAKRSAYRILFGKSEGKRPLGRVRRGWVDNIKMILERLDSAVWIRFIWLRLGTSGGLFLNGNEPSGSIKSSSRRTQLLGRKTVMENSHGKF